MQSKDQDKIWTHYYSRKKTQRLAEAVGLWAQLSAAGVNDETILGLDFAHFGPNKSDVEDLARQLSENYELHVTADEGQKQWIARGTTRPYGITLTREQHLGWVEFMADVAQSYACIFSTWSLEAPSLGVHFHSADVESES